MREGGEREGEEEERPETVEVEDWEPPPELPALTPWLKAVKNDPDLTVGGEAPFPWLAATASHGAASPHTSLTLLCFALCVC